MKGRPEKAKRTLEAHRRLISAHVLTAYCWHNARPRYHSR